MSTMPMPLNSMDSMTSQNVGELGNRVLPPRRAIDKILMSTQQNKPSMAFPMGIPQNEQPPNQPGAQGAGASSFLNAVLGNSGPR